MGEKNEMEMKQPEGEDMVKMSVVMDLSTVQWPEDRQIGGKSVKGDRMSMRSDLSLREASSWTESDREMKAERESKGGGAYEQARSTGEGMEHLKKEQEEEAEENNLPEQAAQVFSPAVNVAPSPSSPRDAEVFWEMEKSPFLISEEMKYNHHGYHYEFTEDMHPARCAQSCPGRDSLKVGVSLVTSALFFPLLVWGLFVFLPFDAPPLDSIPLRLVYTLRCSVFAAAPIVLGWLVLGVSRLRAGASQPFFADEVKEAELKDVCVHRRFISDSASLFLIYFLQLVVLAMYLSQEQLKLVPLLTIVFAFGRLAYWVAAAFGSSVRGFGFGLSFLPSVVMMVANFYFIFTVEAASSIFSGPTSPEEVRAPPATKQRFWG